MKTFLVRQMASNGTFIIKNGGQQCTIFQIIAQNLCR